MGVTSIMFQVSEILVRFDRSRPPGCEVACRGARLLLPRDPGRILMEGPHVPILFLMEPKVTLLK